MGVVSSIDNFLDKAGTSTGRFVDNTLEAGGELVCGVRQDYPNRFNKPGFVQGFLDVVCGGLGLPGVGLQSPTFTGGQCDTKYYVYGEFYSKNISSTGCDVKAFWRSQSAIPRSEVESWIPQVQGGVWGIATIQGVFIRIGAITGGDFDNETFNRLGSSNFIVFRSRGDTCENQTSPTYGDEAITLKVVREDRGIDDCGDFPPSLPDDKPFEASDYSRVIEICDRDEQGNFIDCRDVAIELPVEDLYDLPICIIVDGKKICLDADGWSVEDAVEADEEEVEEEEFEEIEVLDYVLITVQEIPPKLPKRITREKAEDSDIYAGYIAWAYIREGVKFFLPAIPIRKERNAFKPPEGITIYNVYSNYELSLQVTEIKKTIKVPKEPTEDTI